MTDMDENKAIAHWKQARKFNPKSLSDWFDVFIKGVVITGMITAGVTGAFKFGFPIVAPQWAELPERFEEKIAIIDNEFVGLGDSLDDVTNEVQRLRTDLNAVEPQILDFRGNLIPALIEVRQGTGLPITMVVRRNVSCDTIVRVRFQSHLTNTIAARHSYDIPAVRAPVTATFAPFTIQLFIPESLPPGMYSYFPEIIPRDCGVYAPIVSPMSLPFRVVSNTPREEN